MRIPRLGSFGTGDTNIGRRTRTASGSKGALADHVSMLQRAPGSERESNEKQLVSKFTEEGR